MIAISFEEYMALQELVFEWADSYDNKVGTGLNGWSSASGYSDR